MATPNYIASWKHTDYPFPMSILGFTGHFYGTRKEYIHVCTYIFHGIYYRKSEYLPRTLFLTEILAKKHKNAQGNTNQNILQQ